MNQRPHVICHMAPSIDGRIVVDRWPMLQTATREYEATAKSFAADAWIIGRVSMEPYAGKAKLPRRGPRVPRTDFIAANTDSYAIALDPSGKLRWTKNNIDGEHVITVLTEGVSDAYLAFLRAQGVSYLFGGKTELDLARVLVKLRKKFAIKKLLLEGGGKINGSFLAANLIDELSVLVVPVADGAVGTPSLFDAPTRSKTGRTTRARPLALISVEQRAGDLLWLRYRVRPREPRAKPK